MATYDDLSLTTRLFMKGYPFGRHAVDPVPGAALSVPLASARIALVTTAGLCAAGQPAFDQSLKLGDASFRELPNTIEVSTLAESQRSHAFDHSGIAADRNLAFPLDRFRELAARGEVGGLNHRHFSFMGSIVGPRLLVEETAPRVARLLADDRVDAVFLTPV